MIIRKLYSLPMSKRTNQNVMTNEARVLKLLRERRGFSMRQAGELMDISGSLVSQVENGRENIPQGKRLKRFLDTYGIKEAKFKNMAKNWKDEQTELSVIVELLPKLKERDLKTIRSLIEYFITH